MSLNPRTVPESLSVNEAHTLEHPLRSPGGGGGSTGTQIQHREEDDLTIDVVLVHGLERATENTWCGRAALNTFWRRELIPYESWPRKGWMMTSGHNANVVPQNRDNAEAIQSYMQRVFTILMPTAAWDKETRKQLLDRSPHIFYRRFDGRRDPVQEGGMDKHYQMLSHSWGQEEIKSKGGITITTPDAGEDAFYNNQDGVFQDNYQANLRQFIDQHSPITAGFLNYSETIGFPRYRRLRRVLGSCIIPAVALSYPTTVSAAAISWRCSHCSDEATPPGSSTSPNVVLMLPLSPGRHILQYLAICSVASVLIYLQGTGVYLKYSFMACSGLLALICVSAGTETMLRFLPLVGLLTLLVSWVCQVSAKIIRGNSCHEIRDELVATPGCGPMEKNPQLSATRDIFRDR